MFSAPTPYRHWDRERVVPLKNNHFRIKFPLADFLSCMPNLDTVVFDGLYHGTSSWGVRRAVLSVPQIRHVIFCGILWDTRAETLPRKLPLKTVAPLTSLDIWRNGYRFPPRVEPQEDLHVLTALLSHIHSSLETLLLPSEFLPLEILRKHDWPRLRKLKLRGERQFNPSMAVLPALSHVRTLRTLTLELAQPEDHGLERQSMEPCDAMGMLCPWRDLETLTISYPHPADEWYSSLSSTLRRLDLRCWPRHYVHILPHDQRTIVDILKWHSPIITSSDMLNILRRCRTSDARSSLRQLDLEFREDHMDRALFQFIPLAFPNLTFLQIHRYRQIGHLDVPVVSKRPCRRLYALRAD